MALPATAWGFADNDDDTGRRRERPGLFLPVHYYSMIFAYTH